ncbi:hypothetical protein L6164_031696 [Bauhinia variegata]|uniref:Uncharacterized protein n=1 Tax=Bauhinia variegata TaxID=167791 RepID=A0ACB9LGH1_BAUVA|nr:hypothetical protein L6164_031696 [Bauhinia variegata]
MLASPHIFDNDISVRGPSPSKLTLILDLSTVALSLPQFSGGSHVFPSSADRENDGGFSGDSQSARVKMTKMKRSGSFSSHNHSKSRFWATICEGLKKVNPWKSKKMKKDGHGGLRL